MVDPQPQFGTNWFSDSLKNEILTFQGFITFLTAYLRYGCSEISRAPLDFFSPPLSTLSKIGSPTEKRSGHQLSELGAFTHDSLPTFLFSFMINLPIPSLWIPMWFAITLEMKKRNTDYIYFFLQMFRIKGLWIVHTNLHAIRAAFSTN